MSESSLSLGFPELRTAIGFYLGYGRTSGSWSAEAVLEIAECLNAGLRQFYFPPPLGKKGVSHEWSFLRPTTTMDTAAADGNYDMPDDFGGLDGDMCYDTAESRLGPIEIIGEHQIRKMREAGGGATSGTPQYGAIRPKGGVGAAGQKQELILWPLPDAIYTLHYRYKVLADAVTSGAPYPYGGMAHAETILASCLAVAESRIEDEKGTKWQDFMERLAASIEHDQKAMPPEKLGYNGDTSDGQLGAWSSSNSQRVTLNGATY